MRKQTIAPTIADDIRALADLYAAVVTLAWRRVSRRAPPTEAQFYGPFEIVRPSGGERDD